MRDSSTRVGRTVCACPSYSGQGRRHGVPADRLKYFSLVETFVKCSTAQLDIRQNVLL